MTEFKEDEVEWTKGSMHSSAFKREPGCDRSLPSQIPRGAQQYSPFESYNTAACNANNAVRVSWATPQSLAFAYQHGENRSLSPGDIYTYRYTSSKPRYDFQPEGMSVEHPLQMSSDYHRPRRPNSIPLRGAPGSQAYDSLHLFEDLGDLQTPSFCTQDIAQGGSGIQAGEAAEEDYATIVSQTGQHKGKASPPSFAQVRELYATTRRDQELASLLPYQPAAGLGDNIDDLAGNISAITTFHSPATFDDASESGSITSTISQTSGGSCVALNAIPSPVSIQLPLTNSSASSGSVPPPIAGTGSNLQQAGSNPPPTPRHTTASLRAAFFKSSPAILILCLILSAFGIWFQASAVSTYFDHHPRKNDGAFKDPDFKSLLSSFSIQTLGLCASLFGISAMADSHIKNWVEIVGLVSFVTSLIGLGVYFLYTTLGDTLMTLAALFQVWIWMMIAFELRPKTGISNV